MWTSVRDIDDTGAKAQIKTSTVKALRSQILELYPNLYGHLDTIWPNKKETIVTQSKLKL